MEYIILIILLIIIFLIIKNLINKNSYEEIEMFYNSFKDFYITNSFYKNISNKYNELYLNLKKKFFKNKKINQFLKDYKNLRKYCDKLNDKYVNKELQQNEDFFNNINNSSLDLDQRKSVVIDDDNNIIIAGAGSGKTLTMVAKVKYLIEKKGIKPNKILCISFTNAAVNSLKQKINNESVNYTTFHSLGRHIISLFNTTLLNIKENELNEVINKYLSKDVMENDNIRKMIIEYFGYYFCIPTYSEKQSLGNIYSKEQGFDFETLNSKYIKYKFKNDEKIKTFKGENVKSLEELIIANFLFLNSVEYEYEKVYDKCSDILYRPDFYLKDYDIYLEHFGINEHNKVPWLTEIEEAKYLDDIKNKRELHKKYNTKLIETYSYFNKDGKFIDNIKKVLETNGIKLNKKSEEDIYLSIINSDNKQYYIDFIKLIKKFISLFKANNYTDNQFDIFLDSIKNEKNEFIKQRNTIFISIVRTIYNKYQKHLKDSNLIDFDDMLNVATTNIKSHELIKELDYDYIIIDEYQDTSLSRYNLIKAISDLSNSKIIVVGDDWQSIYRFTGCDLDIFINNEKYFKNPKVIKIENTYRNSQELIDIAGNFVMKNQKQIKKKLKSSIHLNTPINIYYYDDNFIDVLEKTIDDLVNVTNTKEIYIIGRNNSDLELVLQNKFLKQIKKENKKIILSHSKYPNTYIYFSTVHISKGLEAENVIIVNLKNSPAGFPNKMIDDQVLDFVTNGKNNYEYDEERRLFYVALTRTKNTVNLLVPTYRPSIFVTELLEDSSNNINIINKEKDILLCPKCKTGILKLKVNTKTNKNFLACSNYPKCNYTLNSDDVIKCSCGGYLTKKEGKFKPFYGCSNYPYCTKTIQIDEKI